MSRCHGGFPAIFLVLFLALPATWVCGAEGGPDMKLFAELEKTGSSQVLVVSEPEPGRPLLVAWAFREGFGAGAGAAGGRNASQDRASAGARPREGTWVEVFRSAEVAIGRNGFAPQGEKREGDGRTPSGIFPLRLAFGYPDRLDSKMPYRQATPTDVWVDDPASPNYNRWVQKDLAQASSFELMRRDDDLYKYGIVIEYNTEEVVPGAGSAIFFHVWSGPGRNTAGCVATREDHLVELLRWLDPARRPWIVLGV